MSDTIHVVQGDFGLRGTFHNWVVTEFVPDETKAAPRDPGKKAKVGADVHDGRTGKWNDVGYHGKLDSAILAIRDKAVKNGFDEPDLVGVLLNSTKFCRDLVAKLGTALGRPSI